MAGKKAEFLLGNAVTSSLKRQEQIKAWENSETNKQPSTVLPSRRVPSVKFGDNVVFFAATHSGDLEEVERLVRYEGADVNFVNKDGLTALHQVFFAVFEGLEERYTIMPPCCLAEEVGNCKAGCVVLVILFFRTKCWLVCLSWLRNVK